MKIGDAGPIRLDYDADQVVPSMGRLAWLAKRAGVRLIALTQRHSPGGKGWHLIVTVLPPPRTCMEVVALQAVFGSDVKREACNINRARMVDSKQVSPYWRQRWNVLYGKN